jgi:hypothetical protein
MRVRLMIIAVLITLLSAPAFGQAGDVPQEYQVKAKYLLNIPLFTEMAPQAKSGPSYTICLIGDTPLGSVLGSSRGKQIKNLPLEIRTVEDITQTGNCRMLFIASSERLHLQTLLAEAHRRGVLTVSDMRDFARLGGIINLQTIDNRITFDLNLSAANTASISFSTHLLKLAHDIIN